MGIRNISMESRLLASVVAKQKGISAVYAQICNWISGDYAVTN
jgi:hypothetical protein